MATGLRSKNVNNSLSGANRTTKGEAKAKLSKSELVLSGGGRMSKSGGP